MGERSHVMHVSRLWALFLIIFFERLAHFQCSHNTRMGVLVTSFSGHCNYAAHDSQISQWPWLCMKRDHLSTRHHLQKESEMTSSWFWGLIVNPRTSVQRYIWLACSRELWRNIGSIFRPRWKSVAGPLEQWSCLSQMLVHAEWMKNYLQKQRKAGYLVHDYTLELTVQKQDEGRWH